MSDYEEDQFYGNESTHSLESEFGGFDVPIIRSPDVKKALTSTNEQLCHSTREKNQVSRFGYDDYMAYHYAFTMKVAIVREPENVSEVANHPRWVEAINEEMLELCKNKT